jgi:hypothetical protein
LLFHTAASTSHLFLRFFRGRWIFFFLVWLCFNYLIEFLRVIRDLIAQLRLPNLTPILGICLPLYLLIVSGTAVQLLVRLNRLLNFTNLRHVHLEQVDTDAPVAEDEDLVPAAVGELLER